MPVNFTFSHFYVKTRSILCISSSAPIFTHYWREIGSNRFCATSEPHLVHHRTAFSQNPPGFVFLKVCAGLDVPGQLNLHIAKQRHNLQLL